MLVFDRHMEEMKSLHDHLIENKMSFEQFLRTVNFVRDMTQEQLNSYIDAYKNGEFSGHGWYQNKNNILLDKENFLKTIKNLD